MRPSILNPLFKPVTGLPGVGPKLGKLFGRLLDAEDDGDGPRVVDLLCHFPSGVVDRRHRPSLAAAVPGEIATVKLTVAAHRPPRPGSRSPYRVYGFQDGGDLTLVFFKASQDWVRRALPEGETVWVSGRIDEYGGELQMVHPDHIIAESELSRLPSVEPVYPLTEGLSSRMVARAVGAALDALPALEEWQDADWLKRQGWPGFAAALTSLHHPETPADAAPESPGWSRLAYDELLAGQLALALVRRHLRGSKGIARTGDGSRLKRVLAALPFALTDSQHRAIEEIRADLAAPERMLRLLQGDVGSGKTVVGLAATALVAESGAQSALMAPTELLARQHFRTLKPLVEAAGLEVALLTGSETAKQRAPVLEAAAAGRLDILVGTHALFQAGVDFADLGLVVIDEQHRFGVHQRLALAAKGAAADMLVMTATPIPRTLLMSHYGDMDVSRLTEKPVGRRPIDTRAVPLSRLDEVVGAVARTVRDGAQVYWVCPLVDESETLEVTSAETRFAALKTALGEAVGLVHGRMAGKAKDAVMRRFVAGELQVLVATTVIEVGVDVPDASVMVIEHAERFGLAQLHQLRGRVGRGDKPSRCLLVYQPPLGEAARARLAILRETEDGFRIAEEDLKLRGGGELLGTRQSGMPGFRVARPEAHFELIAAARDDARLVLSRDPRLEGARGQALRTLLYLFGRDAAMRLLAAG